MRKVIGIILIIVAVALGYFGIQHFNSSTKEVDLGVVELSANDKGGQKTAYVEFGLAAASLIAGVVLLSQKDKK